MLIYRIGILVIVMNTGMYVNKEGCNLSGKCVSLYHVSACIFGCQQKLLEVGPKAMALDTSQDHKLADNTKIMRIYLYIRYLNM